MCSFLTIVASKGTSYLGCCSILFSVNDRGRSDSYGTGCELRVRSSIPNRSRGAVLLRASRPVRVPLLSCALCTGIIAPGLMNRRVRLTANQCSAGVNVVRTGASTS